MKPDTHTVTELFERDVCYQVPLYQRPYVWKQKTQWEPLWDNLSTLLTHQEGSDNGDVWSHFLGAIVLDQEKTAPGRIPRYTVIDGQQRLTTLQLLIAAVAKACLSAGAAQDGELLRQLVENNPRKAKDGELLKVWPTNANQDSFVAMMRAEGPPPGHVNDKGNLIDEAFEYFNERATEYLNGDDDEDRSRDTVADRAERLRITLCDLLKVVSISLDKDDNAQVIFETLNAQGTPLLSIDLVKNAVFREATVQGKATDQLYDQVWKPQLDDNYWRVDRRQGRLNRPVGELFLMHWLTMRLERVVPATELFAVFREHVLKTNTDAEALIRELCQDAKVMRSLDDLASGSPEGRFFARLTGPLDASTVLPVVLLLFRSPEVTPERRRRALAMLESWLARRVLIRLTTKNYNKFVPSLIRRVKADPAHADEAVHAALTSSEAEVSRWPDDAEFTKWLITRDMYDWVRRDRIVMALAAFEQGLRTKRAEPVPIPSRLSLEHLLPQQWKAHWPLDDDDQRSREERQAALHKIGNLTIVTDSLNSAMQNAEWQTKRTALNDHAVLLLNARLAQRDHWDEAAIHERSKEVAENLAIAWPGPDSDVWGKPV